MKTFEELLASGTRTEIMAVVATNTKRVNDLFAEAEKRADKAPTADELTEITTLDTQTEALQTKAIELKKLDDIKTKNAQRHKDLNEPDYKVPFNGGDPTKSEARVQHYGGVASLKHITAHTPQAAEEAAFRFFQFFAAGVLKNNHATQWCKDNGVPLIPASRIFRDEVKVSGSVNENVNEAGAVLVPPEFDMMLIKLIETYGVFRRFTKMKPMGSDTKNVPRRTGGVTTYWVAAGQTITRSRPAYDNVGLVAKKLAALIAIDSEISEDAAINIADEIAFEIGYAFALAEDQAGFIGDSTSAYGGITGVATKLKGLSGTIANIAGLKVAAGNAYSEILLSDFNAVVGLLPQYADSPNAGWFSHKSFYHNVMQKLELAAGGVTAREISDGDRRARPTFLGYPVNFAQVLPSAEANSQVCTLFGDLSLASMMGDRRAISLFNDPYSLSGDDQVQIRGTERIDITVNDVGNADATAANRVPGPVVGLITAAS